MRHDTSCAKAVRAVSGEDILVDVILERIGTSHSDSGQLRDVVAFAILPASLSRSTAPDFVLRGW